ncbi:MAG TPA: hypothetical protein VEC14_01095 [Reyranellaceae bacterium]|nr:hypothetical protein [Reyranellaceae bacterium]
MNTAAATVDAGLFNAAALSLYREHGPAIADSPFFARQLRTRAAQLRRGGARGVTDAELAAAVGESAQLAGLGGFFSKVKDAFKKGHVALMKPLTHSVRVPQDAFNKWGAPKWVGRMSDLLSEIPQKPWDNKKAVLSVAAGFLSNGWWGMAIAAAALVAQNEVMYQGMQRAQRLEAEAAAFAKLTDQQKAEALASLAAAICVRLNVPETEEGRKKAETYAEAVGLLWSQGKSPARALSDVLSAEVLLQRGTSVDAPDYMTKHAALSDSIEAQLVEGTKVADLDISGIPKSSAASGGKLVWFAAAGVALAIGAPVAVAAGLAAAPLLLQRLTPSAKPAALTSTAAPATTTEHRPMQATIQRPTTRPIVRRRGGLAGLGAVDPNAALAAFFAWARATVPGYYAILRREIEAASTVAGLGAIDWIATIGQVISMASNAASVYGTVRQSENEKKLINAQIEQLRAMTQGQQQAAVSPQVLPMGLNLQTLVLPAALMAGAWFFFNRRRR